MKVPVFPVVAIALLQIAVAGRAAAQGDDLRIVVRAWVGKADGGNRPIPSVASFLEPTKIEKTATVTLTRLIGPCGLGVSSQPVADVGEAFDGSMKKVYSAWSVFVTPTGTVPDGLKFRIQWARSRDNGKPSTMGDDLELTLRAGESLPLDVMPQAPGASQPPSACVALSLAVGVERVLWPDYDRRLVGVDMWLMERLPNGEERGHPIALRGLYGQAIPFFFDSLTEGAKSLDIFGDLQVVPRGRTTEIKITTRSRVDPSALREALQAQAHGRMALEGPGPYYVGSKTTTLQVGPDEVVSLPLPPVGNGTTDAAPFAARALSFRIRVRQIR